MQNHDPGKAVRRGMAGATVVPMQPGRLVETSEPVPHSIELRETEVSRFQWIPLVNWYI